MIYIYTVLSFYTQTLMHCNQSKDVTWHIHMMYIPSFQTYLSVYIDQSILNTATLDFDLSYQLSLIRTQADQSSLIIIDQ